MKKLTILSTVLFVCLSHISSGQSHMYTSVNENSLGDAGWGRWVTSSQDILIVNAGGGEYIIGIYDYGQSHPTTAMSVKYDSMVKDQYLYVYTLSSQYSDPPYEIKTTRKLSEMAKRKGGYIYITFNPDSPDFTVIGYHCKI